MAIIFPILPAISHNSDNTRLTYSSKPLRTFKARKNWRRALFDPVLLGSTPNPLLQPRIHPLRLSLPRVYLSL
jgi:hypothetical protein